MSVYDKLSELNITRPDYPCLRPPVLSHMCKRATWCSYPATSPALGWQALGRAVRQEHHHRRRQAGRARCGHRPVKGTLHAATGGDLNRIKRIVR